MPRRAPAVVSSSLDNQQVLSVAVASSTHSSKTTHITAEQTSPLEDHGESTSGCDSPSNGSSETKNYSLESIQADHELAGLDALEDGRPGERPAYPFTTLIRYAIKGSPKGRLLLEEIYQAIQTRYPYFAVAPSGWKARINSVRHTLSLMTCFEKVPRLLTEPGKGSYWTVNDAMPHAKPSRIRIRKRKTRRDEDASLDTPISIPDTISNEPEGSDAVGESEYYERYPSYEWPENLSQQRSDCVQKSSNQQRAVYGPGESQDSFRYAGGTPARKRRVYDHQVLEYPSHGTSGSDHRPRRSNAISEPELHRPNPNTPTSSGGLEPADYLDYRLVLMSELEKLRNLIGRREDIDKEWCRLMVEGLRGTGLDF